MFENVLENCDQKIYGLEEDIQNMEEILPTFCDRCENVAKPEEVIKDHVNVEHPDDNTPSTSQCGRCDYKSEEKMI